MHTPTRLQQGWEEGVGGSKEITLLSLKKARSSIGPDLCFTPFSCVTPTPPLLVKMLHSHLPTVHGGRKLLGLCGQISRVGADRDGWKVFCTKLSWRI